LPLTDEGKNKRRPTNITAYQPSTCNSEAEATRTPNLRIVRPKLRSVSCYGIVVYDCQKKTYETNREPTEH
jgi:hypothetical protein